VGFLSGILEFVAEEVIDVLDVITGCK